MLAATSPLAGRVAFVTGASSGLGAHLAVVLAAAGARVALAARRIDRLQSLAMMIRSSGGIAEAIAVDVTDGAAVDAAYERCEATLGPADVLLNNAGVATTAAALELDDAQWNLIVDANLTAPFRVARGFAQRCVKRKGPGTIINIASILGVRAGTGVAHYAAAKAGLVHLTRVLALEWARYEIRVNAIAPGYIITDMNKAYLDGPGGEAVAKRIPQRRLGEPRDLDGPVVFLASEASSYVTGVVLPVDGGHLVSGL